jgi:hypothetical protein
MPSIEIICIGQLDPVDSDGLPFAVESGRELRSHRAPRPLFQRDFAAIEGCIYHLGNPDLKTQKAGRAFFAYDLLSDRSRSASRSRYLEFRADFVPAMHDLLQSLIEASPEGRLLFTSDWQCGPRRTHRSIVVTLDEFWRLHDGRKLRLNAANPIHRR